VSCEAEVILVLKLEVKGAPPGSPIDHLHLKLRQMCNLSTAWSPPDYSLMIDATRSDSTSRTCPCRHRGELSLSTRTARTPSRKSESCVNFCAIRRSCASTASRSGKVAARR